MSLILANREAFDSWMGRASINSQLKHAELSSLGLSGSAWWEGVRSAAEGGDFERHGNVALVKCIGALDYKYSVWSWLFDGSCYMGIDNKVQAATRDAGISKIVLYIDSPGGTHHGLLEASDSVYAARQSGKEVVAVVDPEAASAGYWLASQANRIVALKSGWVGSLGSQAMVYSMKRMYDEEGIDIEVLRANISPKKNQGIPYEAITDEARKERQGWVDMAGNQFVEHVMRGRDKTRDEVLKNFGQGAMFFAEDAISRGMVDTIGNLQSELAVESVSSPAERMSSRKSLASSLRARMNDRRPG
jgi:capsid assembly protease